MLYSIPTQLPRLEIAYVSVLTIAHRVVLVGKPILSLSALNELTVNLHASSSVYKLVCFICPGVLYSPVVG